MSEVPLQSAGSSTDTAIVFNFWGFCGINLMIKCWLTKLRRSLMGLRKSFQIEYRGTSPIRKPTPLGPTWTPGIGLQ